MAAVLVLRWLPGSNWVQVKVSLPGGDLKISWQGRGEPVFMSGPAVTVFEGLIEL